MIKFRRKESLSITTVAQNDEQKIFEFLKIQDMHSNCMDYASLIKIIFLQSRGFISPDAMNPPFFDQRGMFRSDIRVLEEHLFHVATIITVYIWIVKQLLFQ